MSREEDNVPNIDDILAEFSSYSEELSTPEKAPRPAPTPQAEPRPEAAPRRPAPSAPQPVRPAPSPSRSAAPAKQPADLHDPFALDLTMPAVPVTPPAESGRASRGPDRPDRPVPRASAPRQYSSADFEAAFAPNTGKRTAAKGKNVPARVKNAPPAPGRDAPAPKAPRRGGPAAGLLGVISAILTVFALAWVAVNVHPSSNSASVTDSRLDLVSRLDVYMNNAAADALGELAYIKKIYKIPENDTVAPMPDAAKYGTLSTGEASKVLDVIQQARDSGLLEDQDVVFDPNADFYYDSTIQYYCDDTILVILWKELIDGNTCSCAEIKIADASQLRRKIADDTYGSSNQYYASTMSRQVNAVVAMNADFYQFRDFGIVAYQRQLYRFNAANYTGMYSMYNCIDNCFVTAGGDFLFLRKGEQTTQEAVEQFMKDNDVLFTIAFGPVLVDDGVVQTCDWYPAGQPTTGYSRAGIGQLDTLHYFYMSLNHSPEKAARWTVDQFAQHMADKGVVDAYGLDGGQTSEIVFQGVPYNYIDFGAERLVSDIIYFATAESDGEVTP